MNLTFSHALRVVICDQCGAHLHAPPEGGDVRCEVCDSLLSLGPRTTDVRHSQRPMMSDEDHQALLRQQLDEPSTDRFESLAPLLDGDALAPQQADAAMLRWRELRAELRDAPDPATVALFHRLTELLVDHSRSLRDETQLRAILETALEEVPHGRYRQLIRVRLVIEAARAGDLAAAEDWLTPCDPRSADLQADTAYRFAVAYLASHRRRFNRVIEVLGDHPDTAPPLAPDRAAMCTVLRANANERLGNVLAAANDLAKAMVELPDGDVVIDKLVREVQELPLCRKSLARARMLANRRFDAARISRPESPAEGKSRPRKSRQWLFVAGCLLSLVAAVAVGPEPALPGDNRADVLFLVMAMCFTVPLVAGLARRRKRRHLETRDA